MTLLASGTLLLVLLVMLLELLEVTESPLERFAGRVTAGCAGVAIRVCQTKSELALKIDV